MNTFKYYTILIFLLILIDGNILSDTLQPSSHLQGHRSLLAVYYPFRISKFPVETSKSNLVPIPEYDNWSIDRIDRDISRIIKSGLNGVLLAIEPSDFNDSHKLEMIKTFLVLASKNDGFKIAYLFAPTRATQLSRSNVSSFMKRKGFLDYQSIYKYADSNVLFFSEKVELTSLGKSDFIYVKLNLSGRKQDGNMISGLIDYPLIPLESNYDSEKYHIVHVYSGLVSIDGDKIDWIVSRKNGIQFHRNLESSLKLSPDLIVISSWNDYAQGSAIENNMFDNTQMQEVLKTFLQKNK